MKRLFCLFAGFCGFSLDAMGDTHKYFMPIIIEQRKYEDCVTPKTTPDSSPTTPPATTKKNNYKDHHLTPPLSPATKSDDNESLKK